MSEIVVLANETLSAQLLLDHLVASTPDRQADSVRIVVPLRLPVVATAGELWGMAALSAMDVADLTAAASQRLQGVLDELASHGVQATGVLSDREPFAALEAEMAARPATHVVISTKPRAISRWLRVDLPRRVAKHFPGVELTVLEQQPALV